MAHYFWTNQKLSVKISVRWSQMSLFKLWTKRYPYWNSFLKNRSTWYLKLSPLFMPHSFAHGHICKSLFSWSLFQAISPLWPLHWHHKSKSESVTPVIKSSTLYVAQLYIHRICRCFQMQNSWAVTKADTMWSIGGHHLDDPLGRSFETIPGTEKKLFIKATCRSSDLKIRPHRFGGEGVLIGDSATLNAQVTFVYIAVAISALAGGGP